jgi:hypothetical protein
LTGEAFAKICMGLIVEKTIRAIFAGVSVTLNACLYFLTNRAAEKDV